jgi:hypothetical protein
MSHRLSRGSDSTAQALPGPAEKSASDVARLIASYGDRVRESDSIHMTRNNLRCVVERHES